MLSDEFEGPYGHYILEKGLLQGRTPQIGTVRVSVTSPNKYFVPSRFGKTEIKNIKYICHYEKKAPTLLVLI